MSVLINIGRRTPRSWFKRQANRIAGLLTFQEHIWTIIKSSMSLAKRKANEYGKIRFVITHEREPEDINYEIEWIKIIVQGTEEQEKEEYEEAMQMHQALKKQFKREFPVSETLKKHFKTRVLSSKKVQEAYEIGHGAVDDNSIAQKLLEMGILTHIEWQQDFKTRDVEIPN